MWRPFRRPGVSPVLPSAADYEKKRRVGCNGDGGFRGFKENVSWHPSNPVFVAGVFRSGTSLLYSVLNQHPQIALMYETDVWDFPEPLSGLRFERNWMERQEFLNQALSRHRLIFGRQLTGLEQVRTPEAMYRTFGEGKGAVLWGEKSPFYCARLRQLARQYPGCSFILLWRDPVEIYRSVVYAGHREPFFRRCGMLSRQIYYQEQMIRQAAELEAAGVRILHVTYAGLIDRTEEVCHRICAFLGIEFHPAMLDLARADFSAVYRAPQHDHLRRGVIERQRYAENGLSGSTVRTLQRYRARWSRLNKGFIECPEGLKTEPSLLERVRHGIAGRLFSAHDNVKRALFEFLPLAWLRTYRQMKQWLFGRHGAPGKRPSLLKECCEHWVTLLTGFLLLAGVATVHCFSNPRFTFLPFYLLPCAFLTLVVGRRWGTLAALISSLVGPVLLRRADSDFNSFWILFWNSAMRFVLLETIVLLLDRVRREVNSRGEGNIR